MNIKMEKKNSNMKFFFAGNETEAGIVLILFSLYVKTMRWKTGLFNERIRQIQARPASCSSLGSIQYRSLPQPAPTVCTMSNSKAYE